MLRFNRLHIVLCTTARFDGLMEETRRLAKVAGYVAGIDYQRHITNGQFKQMFRENMDMRRELGRLPTPK